MPAVDDGGHCVEASGAGQIGRATDDVDPTLRLATKCAFRQHRRLATRWAPARSTAYDQLVDLDDGVERLYVIGTPGGDEHDAALRYLVERELPVGWSHGRHHIDTRAPVYRFKAPDGRTVSVHRADIWTGGAEVDVELLAAAWRETSSILRATFDTRAQLLSTPAATGRELLLRTIPPSRSWPVLPMALQQLIRSTSGQGRTEGWWQRDAEPYPPRQLDQLVEVDARIAYLGLCRELPGGEPWHVRRPRDLDLYARARYLVRFTVPDDWRHVGILPTMREQRGRRNGWAWPNTPGDQAVGWCDGAELLVADRAGWQYDVLEAIVWPRYTHQGPLDRWAKQLVASIELAAERARRGHVPAEVAALVARYLRATAVAGIGSLHGAPRTVTHVVDVEHGDQVPDDALSVRIEQDRIVWTERGRQPTPELAHPEWTAAIWGRMRARLLQHPHGGGALDLDADQVVAFRTDSIWCTTAPSWAPPDDVPVGSYRVKGSRGACALPGSAAELLGRA